MSPAALSENTGLSPTPRGHGPSLSSADVDDSTFRACSFVLHHQQTLSFQSVPRDVSWPRRATHRSSCSCIQACNESSLLFKPLEAGLDVTPPSPPHPLHTQPRTASCSLVPARGPSCYMELRPCLQPCAP